MDFCKSYKFLQILPKPVRRVEWSWRTENGTRVRFIEDDSNEDDSIENCLMELVNICVPAIAVILALITFLRCKHRKQPK